MTSLGFVLYLRPKGNNHDINPDTRVVTYAKRRGLALGKSCVRGRKTSYFIRQSLTALPELESVPTFTDVF